MDVIDNILSTLEFTLDAKNKRHIIGGILMSVSLLFGRPRINSYYIEQGG